MRAIASLSADWETAGCRHPTYRKRKRTGILGGVHAGYMHDFDAWALGVEGDLSFTNASAGYDGFEGIGVDLDSLASLCLRAGWNIDQMMPLHHRWCGFG